MEAGHSLRALADTFSRQLRSTDPEAVTHARDDVRPSSPCKPLLRLLVGPDIAHPRRQERIDVLNSGDELPDGALLRGAAGEAEPVANWLRNQRGRQRAIGCRHRKPGIRAGEEPMPHDAGLVGDGQDIGLHRRGDVGGKISRWRHRR
jgi:hypothetical protein